MHNINVMYILDGKNEQWKQVLQVNIHVNRYQQVKIN